MNAAALYERSCARPFLIAGPCVLESIQLALEVAHAVKEAADALGLDAIFKSSFDKANRTSKTSFRGPGLSRGVEQLGRVAQETGLPVLTDLHLPEQAPALAEVVDVLQIPAFLCRQTDLLIAAAATGRVINIKKGQFMAPWDMRPALDKVRAEGNERVWLTERGATFGYNNLVVDFRSLAIMRGLRAPGQTVPVVFDATHSVQLPGGLGASSGGQREFVPVLARAAVAAGCQGVFLEVHPDPDRALCDGPNSWPLDRLPTLLAELKQLWDSTKDSAYV
jgi:2-dehydro-3-deoxyphosphooctonate aldolase (KDO 8-P synthase)